ncbi:MAG: type IV secretory system conjugative DNA transfer family protein [Pseudomonadota bacterium]
MKRTLFSLLLCLTLLAVAAPASASLREVKETDKIDPTLPPLSMQALQEIEPTTDWDSGDSKLPLDIRHEALKEAALSFGARGGLAARTYDIYQELQSRASYLDRVYNFRNLLIAAPSGLLIEPPIVSESLDALLVEGDGQTAAVADVVYNINRNVRIVSTSRNWRQYLERQWGHIQEPPDILRPKNADERKMWRELVAKGWAEGATQADEIFEQDLNRLAADFNGMIRYRKLLTQGQISAPYATQLDRGITGGGEEMRVGDRAVRITEKPQFLTGGREWQPASR